MSHQNILSSNKFNIIVDINKKHNEAPWTIAVYVICFEKFWGGGLYFIYKLCNEGVHY